MNPNDFVVDHRARQERLQLEADERRERALIDQRSPDNSAEARVRIWETLHQLRLPLDPAHAILPQIARQTALQLAEVLAVQRDRAIPRATAPAGTTPTADSGVGVVMFDSNAKQPVGP